MMKKLTTDSVLSRTPDPSKTEESSTDKDAPGDPTYDGTPTDGAVADGAKKARAPDTSPADIASAPRSHLSVPQTSAPQVAPRSSGLDSESMDRIHGKSDEHYDKEPVEIVCRYCGATVTTKLKHVVGIDVFIYCLVIICIGLIPMCFIPFFMKSCKDVAHLCPACGKQVGYHSRTSQLRTHKPQNLTNITQDGTDKK